MIHPLPAPVAGYFAANDPEGIADCFTEDGIARDERQTHRGRAEILRWREDVAKVSFRQEILRAAPDGANFRVTCRVSGAFKGSPVELDHVFSLTGDRIARLEIS